jgi:hypothetical protein
VIRSGWIEDAFKALGTGAKPRAAVPLLASGPTEGSSAHQGLPGIGPAIRMGLVSVVHFQIVTEPGGKVLDGSKIAPLQEPACQHAEP